MLYSVALNQLVIPRFSNTGENWSEIANRITSICNNNGTGIKEYIQDGYFIPGGQILRGAGYENRVLYNSYVTHVDCEETSKSIANRVTNWTEQGIGVGVNISDWIRAQKTKNSLALDLIIQDICVSQQTLLEKGITRTATMANVDFDIEGIPSIALKISEKDILKHINIGVLLTDIILQKAQIPDTIENHKLRKICEVIWKCGNPGLIFIDNVNKYHPFRGEKINACNACAEQYLLPDEGCCLGAINLSKFTKNKNIDYSLLKSCVFESIAYLDTVIDATSFPSVKSRELAYKRRRIGLGIMGLDTMFEQIGISYESNDALTLSKEISTYFKEFSEAASIERAIKYGVFEDYDKTTIKRIRRNSYLNSIAPTGATSLIFSNSSGIEPIFSSHISKGNVNVKLRSDYNNKKTVFDIKADNQIELLAIWQENIDGGISKTLNIPEDCTIDDIFSFVISSWRKGCKGISIYRQNSRRNAFRIK